MNAAELAEQARERGDQRTADHWQYIADLVAAAPPLSPAQRDRLSILLRPEPQKAAA